jgi:hypothetical protein
VLSILNKEQRGYLTPDEFNKIATQVQLDIFESFFEDYNQYIRMPKTDVEFASRMDHIKEEFQIFEELKKASNNPTTNIYHQPTNLHRFGSVFYNRGINSPEVEIVSQREYKQQTLSPILQPSLNFPIATYKDDKITVFPEVTTPLDTDVSFSYIRKPKDVVWAYTIGSLGQYLFNNDDPAPVGTIPSTGSVDFEISDSQQVEVVLQILQYTGLVIRDPQIIQAASQELAQQESNEKR